MNCFVVSAPDDGKRVERILRERLCGLSRRSIHALLASGSVFVGSKPCREKGVRVAAGCLIRVGVSALSEKPVADPGRLEVVRATPDLLVINKPAGIHCHPLRAGETGTLANLVVAEYPECADASPDGREGGLVHRLDWGTSGVIVAARSRAAYLGLRRQFAARRVHKRYQALVAGQVGSAGLVVGEVVADLEDRRRMKVLPPLDRTDEELPRSRYRLIAKRGMLSWVEVVCVTGRRHQVRAHLASAGYPLVGDKLYGGGSLGLETTGPFLHAEGLSIEGRTYRAPLPAQRLQVLSELGIAG